MIDQAAAAAVTFFGVDLFAVSLAAAFRATRRMAVPELPAPELGDPPTARPLVRLIGVAAVEWALVGHQMPGRRNW